MLDRRFLDVSIVVAGVSNSPAASPTAGTQYIVGSSPAGDFSGATANQLARYDGSKWIFSTPKTNGLEVLNVETKEVLSFDGTAWTTKATLGGGESNEFIAPVDLVTNLALIHPYGSPVSYPDNAEVGDKIVVIGYFNDKYVSVDIRRKEENDWNLVSKMTNGQRYAVKYRDANNNFIYEILAGISISDNPADPTGNQITRETIPVGGMFLNKADSLVYVYDGENFVATGVSGGTASEFICETHTLTAEEATAKSFTLANSIKTGKETDVFLSVCGMVQIAGVDYTASENTISWSDKTLADIGLQAGDVFLVQYVKG